MCIEKLLELETETKALHDDVLAKSYAHTTDVIVHLVALISQKNLRPWFDRNWLAWRSFFSLLGFGLYLIDWFFSRWWFSSLILPVFVHTSSGENVTGNDYLTVFQYRYDSHPSCSHVSSSNHGKTPWLILSHKMTSHVGAPSSPLGIAHSLA